MCQVSDPRLFDEELWEFNPEKRGNTINKFNVASNNNNVFRVTVRLIFHSYYCSKR